MKNKGQKILNKYLQNSHFIILGLVGYFSKLVMVETRLGEIFTIVTVVTCNFFLTKENVKTLDQTQIFH
jgi:hypothetical protein